MIGIRGLGMYAPSAVRTNDWWSRDLVDQWVAERRTRPRPELPSPLTDGARRVLEAAAPFADDPFQGTVERRILDPGMTIEDMEERAAREAIARSGVAAQDIDLVLTYTAAPTYQLQNAACILHQRLGLPRAALSLQVEATAYAVFAQLALAEAMITAGRAKHALLVQSSALSRVVEPTHPLSVLVGDAATAIVIGPTQRAGILATAHFTDGRFPESLVLALDGPRRLVVDPHQLWEAQLTTADVCKDSVDHALASAKLAVADIDFLCVFQGTAWLQGAIAAHVGANHAKSVEVFRRFGYLSGAAITASLYIGDQQGRLMRDDLVVMTGGGTGQTYGAAVLRWGNV